MFGGRRYAEAFPETSAVPLPELDRRWAREAGEIFRSHPVLTVRMFAWRGGAPSHPATPRRLRPLGPLRSVARARCALGKPPGMGVGEASPSRAAGSVCGLGRVCRAARRCLAARAGRRPGRSSPSDTRCLGARRLARLLRRGVGFHGRNRRPLQGARHAASRRFRRPRARRTPLARWNTFPE